MKDGIKTLLWVTLYLLWLASLTTTVVILTRIL